MYQYLKHASCHIWPIDGSDYFTISIYNEYDNISENETIENDEINSNILHGELLYMHEDKNGNKLQWTICQSPSKTPLELHTDVDEATDSFSIVLREECRYYVELDLPEEQIKCAFPQLNSKRENSYSTMSNVPKSRNLWLLQTKSTAGVLPLSVGNFNLLLEVRPSKLDYLNDYRKMIADLAQNGVDALLDPRSPIDLQLQMLGDKRIQRSPYLQAITIDALYGCTSFLNAIALVARRPYRESGETTIEVLTGIARGANAHQIIEGLAHPSNLSRLPYSHPLACRLKELAPRRIEIFRSVDELANKENRFLVFVFETIINTVSDVSDKLSRDKRLNQAGPVIKLLENLEWLKQHLLIVRSQEPFVGIKPLAEPPTQSTVMTGRPGYREIYATWIQWNSDVQVGYFDIGPEVLGGSKLLWKLYQDWCLLMVHKALELGPPRFSQGVEWDNGSTLWILNNSDATGSYLNLVPGKSKRKGNWAGKEIQLYYEHKFPGGSHFLSSYSVLMKPDITILLKDKNDPVTRMIHFDSKYSVEKVDSESNTENIESTGTVRSTDMEKMHAYQDGLRSPLSWSHSFITEGTFVLYPGSEPVFRTWDREVQMHDTTGVWHPGIGASPLNPGDEGDLIGLRALIWNWISAR